MGAAFDWRELMKRRTAGEGLALFEDSYRALLRYATAQTDEDDIACLCRVQWR